MLADKVSFRRRIRRGPGITNGLGLTLDYGPAGAVPVVVAFVVVADPPGLT